MLRNFGHVRAPPKLGKLPRVGLPRLGRRQRPRKDAEPVHGLAREAAPLGVTVNCISPAVIDTDIMGGPITADRAPAFLSALPVGRLGTVDEVAALLEFLLGPDAGYITGATYNINGGLRIG